MQEKLHWTIWHKSLSQPVPNTAIWKCRRAGGAFKRKPIRFLTHEGLINHRNAPICGLNTLINTSTHIPYVSHCHLLNTILPVINVPACSYIKYIIGCVFSLHRELTARRMDGGVSFHRFKGHLAVMSSISAHQPVNSNNSGARSGNKKLRFAKKAILIFFKQDRRQ